MICVSGGNNARRRPCAFLVKKNAAVQKSNFKVKLIFQIENEEFVAFKEALADYSKEQNDLGGWVPRFAFGLAPCRQEYTEPLVYLYQNDDNIFATNEEFQNLIVHMFIPLRIHTYRYSVLEPFWAAEHTAALWTKLFPTYAAFTSSQNRPLSRLPGTAQYDFDAISLQFHLDP